MRAHSPVIPAIGQWRQNRGFQAVPGDPMKRARRKTKGEGMTNDKFLQNEQKMIYGGMPNHTGGEW